jgi:transposase
VSELAELRAQVEELKDHLRSAIQVGEQQAKVIEEQTESQRLLVELRREQGELAAQQAEAIRLLTKERDQLLEQVQYLLKQRFGRSSERIAPGQLSFLGGDIPEPEVTEVELIPRKKRKKGGNGRERFPEHLPRNVVSLELDEDARTCECGAAMNAIGADVTERGRLIPAKIIIDRYERTKYACPHGHGIRTADLPDGVIDGGKYDASVYAHVAVAKYQDHLPLNRLEGIFGRYGLKLPKQTMWDMLVTVDDLVARAILAQMHRELLAEGVLQADETPVRLRIEGQKGSKDAYVFGYRSLADVADPKAMIDFRTDRTRAGPSEFLGDWEGTLIIDGYSGYNEVCERNGIRRAGCWAHARRKVKDALDAGDRKAGGMLLDINRLFAIERALRGRIQRLELDTEVALDLRGKVRARTSAKRVIRILDRAQALDADPSVLPKSRLGKALTYLFNQQQALAVFLEEPRIPIHNNDQERDLRHVVTGRKNWLVFGSQKGGEVACRLYSLMLSCRQNGVDPEAYLRDVLMAVATTPESEIASLTPWAWKRRQAAAAKVCV